MWGLRGPHIAQKRHFCLQKQHVQSSNMSPLTSEQAFPHSEKQMRAEKWVSVWQSVSPAQRHIQFAGHFWVQLKIPLRSIGVTHVFI